MSLKSTKNKLAIVVVLIISLILAVMILNSEKNESSPHDHHDANHENHEGHESHNEHGIQDNDNHAHNQGHTHPEAKVVMIKGSHGGKLFKQDDFSLEVTIFERHTPPEFRLYTYQNGEALPPNQSKVMMQLKRLGRDVEHIHFNPEKDYLKGDVVVKEPHSFEVKIMVEHGNKQYAFNYEQAEARVTLSEEQLKHNSIEVLTAGPAKIQSTVTLQGEVKLNADKSAVIVPRVGGIVESVSVNAGDTVKKGQVLASISSQAVADIRGELLSALKQVQLSNETYLREKQLWEEKISAKQDYLQAEKQFTDAKINAQRLKQKLGALGTQSSNNNLALYTLRAPINGIITQKNISQGQVVDEVDRIFEIADLSTVWIETLVYAKDLRTVKPGQKVTIKSDAIGAEAIGTIAYVSALVGKQSRTATARIVLDNTDRTWPPGLPINVQLIADEVNVPLAVSTEGLQTVNDWQVVFARYGDNFEARPIKIGRRDDRYIEVLAGIEVGELYAAGNSFIIKADLGKAGATHDH